MKRLSQTFASTISLILASILVVANLAGNVLAAVGDLDNTFGTGGKVITHILSDFNTATSVAAQADGKILAAGAVSDGPGENSFGLVRYQSNGNLDANFGAGGKVITNFLNAAASISDIAVQANGFIVVVGPLIENGQNASDFAIARYTTNGSLDASFGIGGKVITDFSANSNDIPYAVAIQADGKIVVAGSSTAGAAGSNDMALARYNTNGALDVNFGSGGKVTTAVTNGSFDYAADLAIQTDGKIVVAGSTSVSINFDFVLVRYNTNGVLDSGFGNNGKVVTNFSGKSNNANAIAIQGDGRIVVGGTISSSIQDRDFIVARYNTNGALDTGFGVVGYVTSDFYGNADFLGRIAIQANGAIVAAGTAFITNNGSNFVLARFTANGSPDAGFGNGGKVTTNFLNHSDGASDVIIQANGQIIAAGGTGGVSVGQADFALARYNGDGVVINFDGIVQDESSDNLLAFNSTTGEYQFIQCSSGFVLGGQGSITIKACTVMLQHNTADRRILVKYDTCTKKATASVQVLSTGMIFSITDKDTTNNVFSCPIQ